MGRRQGHGVHFLCLFQAQGLVGVADHMQRAGGNGFQRPQLVHRQRQIGPVLRLPDAHLQAVLQSPGLFTVGQGFRLSQLLVQPGQLCLLAGRQVGPQGGKGLRNATLLPVLAHGRDHRAVLAAACFPDAGLQRRQPVHGVLVQNGHIRKLRHLHGLGHQRLGDILPRLGPQDHLVQRRRIAADAPLQLVRLPGVPGFLCPLLGQRLGHGNVFVPLLARRLDGNGISLGLFLLPGLGLPLVLLFPFQNVVLLEDELPLRPVGTALFACHLPGQFGILRFHLPPFQRDLIQHLPPLIPQPLFLGLPFPLVGLPQHFQLFVQVPYVGDVHTQRVKILVQQLFGLSVPLLLLRRCPGVLALCSRAAVFPQLLVEQPRLFLLHALQTLQHLGGPLFAACRRSSHGPVVLLDAVKNGLHILHLVQIHHVAQHLARQFHLGVLVFGRVGKAAHHPGLDGVVHVHQHIQPLGALHAGCPCHSGAFRRVPEQRRRSVLHAAHGPGVVHDALILFRRVAVAGSGFPPQLHPVAPGVLHCRAPAAVPPHQFLFGLSVFGHGVAQAVQFRVLVP